MERSSRFMPNWASRARLSSTGRLKARVATPSRRSGRRTSGEKTTQLGDGVLVGGGLSFQLAGVAEPGDVGVGGGPIVDSGRAPQATARRVASVRVVVSACSRVISARVNRRVGASGVAAVDQVQRLLTVGTEKWHLTGAFLARAAHVRRFSSAWRRLVWLTTSWAMSRNLMLLVLEARTRTRGRGPRRRGSAPSRCRSLARSRCAWTARCSAAVRRVSGPGRARRGWRRCPRSPSASGLTNPAMRSWRNATA